MQNKKFRLRNNLILDILFSFSSVTLALFGFLAILPPASESEVSAIIDGEQFALTITNNEEINLDINPTKSGSIAIAKDTITANTNSPAGYKLYVSTDSTTNDIYLDGQESNNVEGEKLIATTGTNELPAVLENNSWGFAVAGAGNFDSAYNTTNPSVASKFAAVPEKDNEQLIHDHSGRATDDETEIYFAAKVDTNITSGNYITTILYTTLSEATDQDRTEINLSNSAFTTNYATGNKTITIDTSIMSSKTPTITVKIGTKDAMNVTIVKNAPLSIAFDLPANLSEGLYDVTIYITNLAKSYTKEKAIGIYKPMQEMTTEFCASMTLEEQKQFLDTRDNKIYWAAKLKDGNCWMTQNLDYNPSENGASSNNYGYINNTEEPSPISCNGSQNDAENCHYHIGNQYTFSEANDGVCPSGWRLPAAGEYINNVYSFSNLLSAYEINNADSATAAPLYFVTKYANGYWTGTAENSNAYAMILNNGFSSQSEQAQTNKYFVRCLARGKTYELKYDANGGSGAPQAQKVEEISTSTTKSFTISSTTPTRSGYQFKGWSTNENATSASYSASQNISIDTGTTTLYAVWEAVCSYSIGQTWTIQYSGSASPVSIPTQCEGVYKLEVWGAAGSDGNAGAGGYAVGYKNLTAETTLYVVAGGRNSYNGGGVGDSGGKGGGATHIATTNRGTLKEYSAYQDEVLIVAGGGGGGGTYGSESAKGGNGGGTSGKNGVGGSASLGGCGGKGGTQTAGGSGCNNSSGGSFGRGGKGVAGGYSGGGGGGGAGWYGGGGGSGYGTLTYDDWHSYGSGGQVGGGGGGSSYIENVPTITYKDVTYSPSTTAGANSKKDGYATITYMAK